MKTITQNSTTTAAKILFNLLGELGFNSIKEYQSRNGLYVDGYFGMKSYKSLYSSLLNVKEYKFTDFRHSTYPKKQIIWHHAAGWDNARGMFSSWQRDSRGRVATAIGITDDGTVTRGFDEGYWASAIGCKTKVFRKHGVKLIQAQDRNGKWYTRNNSLLDMAAIQVEICNAGRLEVKGDKIVSWFDWEVPEEKVVEVNYKGYKYYEKYTDEELEALKYWTILMGIRFDIPINYNHEDMWEVNKKALSGVSGIYTHNSYRVDKTDVSPQKNLIKMAKSLDKYMR